MKERRRGNRYCVQDVVGTLLFHAEATILNMSISGMAVQTHGPLRVRSTYSARLRHGRRVLPLQGTVVWCHLRSTRKTESGDVLPVYEAGLRFQDVLSEQAQDLMTFLEETAVISLETRIYGRFKVELAEAVDLAVEREFTVREISTSGMLIEADLEPAEGAVFDMEVRCDGESFCAKGRVARIRPLPGGAGERHAIGVAFTEVSPADRRVLQGFIARQLG